MRPDEKDAAYLWDMIRYAREAAEFVSGRNEEEFRNDRVLRYAVERVVENIGQAAYRLSDQFKAAHPHAPWIQFEGQRHRLVHDYGRIIPDLVRLVATRHAPELVTQLEPLIPPAPPDPDPEADKKPTERPRDFVPRQRESTSHHLLTFARTPTIDGQP